MGTRPKRRVGEDSPVDPTAITSTGEGWAIAPILIVLGIVGWGFVPGQRTASLGRRLKTAGNAAKYGESFEHMAEHALQYFFYSALLGAVAFGVAALVVVWRFQ